MNFRRAFEPDQDAFQIAPLIDVVFLLLIFFIVTGALAAEERETPIQLPRAASAVTLRRERLDVVVNITRDGQIVVNNQTYSVAKLRQVLVELQRSAGSTPVSVIIRGDADSAHKDFVKVLDACAAAKVERVSVVSSPADKTGTN